MLELDPHNTLDYLAAKGLITDASAARVTPLPGGVSGVVLKVEILASPSPHPLPYPPIPVQPSTFNVQRSTLNAQPSTFILKQSRPQLRTRDPWFSRLDRIYCEADAMRALAPLLPPATVPQVLFEDRDNFLLIMTAAPPDHRVWKDLLLAGQADPAIAHQAAAILARIHAGTSNNSDLRDRFADTTVFVELRVDPFHRRIAQVHPDLKPRIDALVDEMLATQLALTHADFSPKNLLVHSAGLTLVDYETAHFGDPAFDLGFFTSHLILKAFKNLPTRDRFFNLIRTFHRTYTAAPLTIHHSPLTPPTTHHSLLSRSIAHFAVCGLARLDATSKIDYLPEEPKRAAVRQLFRTALLDRIAEWEDVLAAAEQSAASRFPNP